MFLAENPGWKPEVKVKIKKFQARGQAGASIRSPKMQAKHLARNLCRVGHATSRFPVPPIAAHTARAPVLWRVAHLDRREGASAPRLPTRSPKARRVLLSNTARLGYVERDARTPFAGATQSCVLPRNNTLLDALSCDAQVSGLPLSGSIVTCRAWGRQPRQRHATAPCSGVPSSQVVTCGSRSGTSRCHSTCRGKPEPAA